MKIKKIYLAGKVSKNDSELKDKTLNWREEIIQELNKINSFEYLDPQTQRVTETDSKGVFGMCCDMVLSADLIIVQANRKLGLGTAQEILIAKSKQIPVISILPKNTHLRRDLINQGEIVKDWIHPFIQETSDILIENEQEITTAIKELENMKIKDLSLIDDCRNYYLQKYK